MFKEKKYVELNLQDGKKVNVQEGTKILEIQI